MKKYLKQFTGTSSRIWLFIILPLLVVAGIVFYDSSAEVIIHQPSGDRAFLGEINKGMTILDVVSISTQAGNIDFRYSINSSGVEIYKLGDFTYGKGDLSFKLNGKSFEYNKINEKRIRPGNKVEIFIK